MDHQHYRSALATLYSALALEADADQIRTLYLVTNPDKFGHLRHKPPGPKHAHEPPISGAAAEE